jgi:hypothetical protein
MKALRNVVIAVVVLALVGVGGYWLLTSSTLIGQDLRDYVSKQILQAVNDPLVPQLDWDKAEFERPGTLRLNDVSLVAPDGTDVVRVATAEIVLAELPSIGEPIAIERVTLSNGTVRIISDGQGGYVGLTPFVKDSGDPKEDETDGEKVQITDILNLRRIEITGINLVYDDGNEAGPMELPGFELVMDIKPAGTSNQAAEGDPVEAGDEAGPRRMISSGAPTGEAWYDLDFDVGRKPGFVLDVVGRVNINTYAAWLDGTTASITVDENTLGSLPGRVRNLMEQYKVRGEVTANINGLIDPLTLANSNATAKINASGVNVSVGEYRFPLTRMVVDATLQGALARLDTFELEAVDGRLDATGSYPLDGVGAGEVRWTATGFDLQQFLASDPGSGPPKIAGLFATEGRVSVSGENPQESLSGEGTFELSKGRLVALPIVSQLANILAVFDALESATTLNHRANGTYAIKPDRVVLSDTRLVTTAYAAEIRGPIYYDQTLDLKVNAGPFRRAQQLFGETLSNIFNALTPELVTYRVRGTLSDPKVSVSALGGGKDKEREQDAQPATTDARPTVPPEGGSTQDTEG